jgi:hypothetical protein
LHRTRTSSCKTDDGIVVRVTPFLFSELSDSDLLARVREAAQAERRATATLIALLMEVDARRLYLGEGYSSLFTFCTQALHLSEHAAYGRIEAARAARKFPVILERLAAGDLTLTSVCLVAPHLTQANAVAVLAQAAGKTKRDVEQIVAQLAPKPDVCTTIKRLPTPSVQLAIIPASGVGINADTRGETRAIAGQATGAVGATSVPNMPQTEITVLAPERFKLQLTVGRDTYNKLQRLQSLLRHSIPTGDVEAIFDRALTVLLERAEREKFAATKKPRGCRTPSENRRYIPAAVKRAVWTRDEGRCAFVGTRGRCTETAFLEFQHVTPFAHGGAATEENLELRCRAHNAYEEERRFAELPRPSDV